MKLDPRLEFLQGNVILCEGFALMNRLVVA